jgi:hypothetical protein
VPRVRDLLYRFRPVGAPGAASAAGVPVDRRADIAAELEPLFAQLARTERACAEVREQGRRDAERVRARDAEQARAIVAAANAGTRAERAAANTTMQQHAKDESAAMLAAAQHEARNLHSRAAERIPEYLTRVLGSIRSLLDDDGRGAGAA